MTLKQIEKETKSKIKRKEIPTVEDIFKAKSKGIVPLIKEGLKQENYQRFIPLVEQLEKKQILWISQLY